MDYHKKRDKLDPKSQRLQKFLAGAGVASRRKSEEIITAGRVSVNGQVVTELGTKVLPGKDIVALDGNVLHYESWDEVSNKVSNKSWDKKAHPKYVYIMLHKPEGVITSTKDPQNRRTVLDFVQDIPVRLFPVGRLDYDSSGLLLLTNDGELTQKLTHPSHSVPKTYIARLLGEPSKEGLSAFRKGLVINMGGGLSVETAAAKISILESILDRNYPKANHAKTVQAKTVQAKTVHAKTAHAKSPSTKTCTAKITIYEGKNRQVRKMCEAIGCRVLQLKRVAMGSLKLGNLPRGEYRHLTKSEIESLKCERNEL